MKLLIIFLSIFALFQALYCAQFDELTVESDVTDVIEAYLKDGIQEYISAEDHKLLKEQYHEQYYEGLGTINFVKLLDMFSQEIADNKTCQMCNSVMGLGKTLLQSREVITVLLGGLCKDTPTFSKRACQGALELNADPVVWLFKNTKLQSQEICAVLVGHDCLNFLNFQGGNKNIFWELPLPPKKEFKPVAPSSDKHRKILHITDIHLDLWYEPGTNVSCNDPLCCRANSDDPKGHNWEAGYWADIRASCDTPEHFVDNTLRQIAHDHPDLDAVYFTGDNVASDIWNTTVKGNLKHIKTVSDIIAKHLPNAAVFPLLGNHETHPVNLYIPDSINHITEGNFSMKWLYEGLATDIWAKWIDTPETKKTFIKGGYFSKMYQNNWKIVVLNTNTPQRNNFWTLYDPLDPDGHLDWLIKELDHAESIGAYVTILGHIPPKMGIYNAWLHNYIRIMDRYSHLITSGFFGHTHKDEIIVLYNEAKKPVSVNYISGSLTTAVNLNPSYSIFEVDSRGYPVDYFAYFTDIVEANQHHKRNPSTSPTWQLEYHPRKSYQLADLTPASWDKFFTAAHQELDLAYLYVDHYHRHSAEYTMQNPISAQDMKNMLRAATQYPPFDPMYSLKEGDEEK